MGYEPHELSIAFPDMPAAQFKRLAEDIRENGLRHPIVLFEGRILDGRHRYRACIEVGVEPRFEQFAGDDPVSFVTSENAARRHLTESQLAYAVSAMAEYERRKARERMSVAGAIGGASKGSANVHHPIQGAGRTADKLAAKAGIGSRTVSKAIKVREKGTEELKAAVAAGEIALHQAEKIVQLNPDAQRRIIETPKSQRGAAMREALNRSDSAKRRDAKKAAAKIAEPGTSFVRKFLSGVERVTMVCAEEGAKDGAAIASRFLDEMDWSSDALKIQLERCEPVLRALAIIQQQKRQAA